MKITRTQLTYCLRCCVLDVMVAMSGLRVEEVGSCLKGWRTRGPHRAVQRLLSRRENPLSRRKSSCVVLGEEVLMDEDGCHWSSIH